MYQCIDGNDYYFQETLEYVLYASKVSSTNIYDNVTQQNRFWEDVFTPPSTKYFLYFGRKHSIPPDLIYRAINIFDRLAQKMRKEVREVALHIPIKDLKARHTSFAFLDMILSLGLAICFDARRSEFEISLSEIASLCRENGLYYSIGWVAHRQAYLFRKLDENVSHPSIMNVSSHILMLITLKFRYLKMMIRGNIQEAMIYYAHMYFQHRELIYLLITSKIATEESLETKIRWWLHGNGHVTYIAGVVVVLAILKLTNLKFGELPNEVLTNLRDWLDLDKNELGPIVEILWKKDHFL